MSMANPVFLTAAWKNLVMVNYEIEPALLLPYLPAFTELDTFNGKTYVSFVGFMFDEVRIKGIAIPFHTSFPEVNLRFYVKHTEKDGTVNRGVVFISEIVPKRAIAWVANVLYKEKYIATVMRQFISVKDKNIALEYRFRLKGKEHFITANAVHEPAPMQADSEEAFIFEHYNGYAKVNSAVTNQYKVEHPSWSVFPITNYKVECSFEEVYGPQFSVLDKTNPTSVFVAEGSPVIIRSKTVLRK